MFEKQILRSRKKNMETFLKQFHARFSNRILYAILYTPSDTSEGIYIAIPKEEFKEKIWKFFLYPWKNVGQFIEELFE